VTCQACGRKCWKDARTCKGRSQPPLEIVQEFYYETQEDHLCAKHAINNTLALCNFATEASLNAIVAGPRNQFGGMQNRRTGYAVQTVQDFLTAKGVTLVNRKRGTAHPLPMGDTWASACAVGLLCFADLRDNPARGSIEGHYFAVVPIMHTTGTYFRLIDSIDLRIVHFASVRHLGHYMDNHSHKFLDVLELKPGGPIGTHPDLDHSQYTTYEM
jgi:hypothetical protein